MSSAPLPQPSKKNDYSSPSDLFPVAHRVEDFKKFFATRRAILSGEPLYMQTTAELSSHGYMSPWIFNTMQSVICAIPGMLVAAITWLFIAQEEPVPTALIDPIQQNIYSVLRPLQPPFTLLLVVYVLGYCCLPSAYVSVANWRAAQRKYLYLDASYGVWPQFLMALCLALVPFSSSKQVVLVVLGSLASIALLGASIWQVIVMERKVKQELFEYDYVAARPQMFGLLEDRPFFKFHVIGILGLSLVIPLLSTGLYGVSIVLANFVHKLRS